MGTVDLPSPGVGPLSRVAPKPIKFVLNWGRRYSLWVFNFGLACCAIEFIATSMSRHDFMRLGVIPFAPGPRQADLMVVSGTVSDKMAPAVRRLYEQMPEPKYVISFGACSNCGGPYWDSYCVTKGVDQIIPVDVYVPGCPPRPEALLHGIVHLQERIAAENLGDRYDGDPVTPPPPPRPLSPTVLRRPLQPPPEPEPKAPSADVAEARSAPEHDETPLGPPDADAVHAADVETQPVQALEDVPPSAGPADETVPVAPVDEPADDPAPARTPDSDETMPVAPVDDPDIDETVPVRAIEEDPPRFGLPGRRARDRDDHDPTIIPGLSEGGHDDEIGRDR
ncbi:NADH-quinone oxidoreductase subunit B [Actinomadura algeriensis]|uniref:NADH-quinone oxidoreductase subunit B n=1 Tax=Actinomadura algeriensis TaxID=1679523 RepID=A0ABR9JM47_9ACTN|nr:NADH-quinone oxidoreductase subunit B [Actinomadura algeriensis]MBE1531620.1 NADH-quinone oxidoreductase B subunit [Actinomadura algeriensis]